MRDNTLIVFASDNGGTRSNMFAGEAEVKGELPPDNGPYRDGKGSVYEGGTRVVALANWPGRIKPGIVGEMIHIVDIYPTLAGLAGAELGKNKPLDGVDVWQTISQGRPSPRDRHGVQRRTVSRRRAQGRLEACLDDVASAARRAFRFVQRSVGSRPTSRSKIPEKVKELQAWAIDLSKQAVPPLFLMELIRLGLSHAPDFPDLGGTDD